MRRSLRSVLAALAACAASVVAIAAPRASAREPAGEVVVGIVTEAETKRPIAGARVSLWTRDREIARDGGAVDADWPKSPFRSAQTDERGAFAIDGVPAAKLRWVVASAPGRATAVALAGERGVSADFALAAAPVWKAQFMRPGPSGDVPAAQCEVLLFPGGTDLPPSGRFTSDAQGWVSLAAAPGASLLVRGPGVATSVVSVRPGPVQLRAGGPVAGEVVGPNGRAVEGAVVRLRTDAVSAEGKTDLQGRFSFDGVPSGGGEASLVVEAPGLPRTRVPAAGGGPPLRIVLRAAATVRGRVVDATGNPVPGAAVTESDALDDGPAPAGAPFLAAAADGSFEFSGVTAGLRRIRAVATVGGRQAAGQAIVLAGGDVPSPVDVVVRPSEQRIPVRILDAAGAPIARIAVFAGEGGTGAWTRADGTAEPGLAANSDAVSNGTAIDILLSGGPLGADSVWVAVPRRAIDAGRADIAVVPGRTLRLRPVGENGKPLGLAELSAFVSPLPGGGDASLACHVPGDKGEPGTCVVPAAAGYRLTVFADGLADWFFSKDCAATDWPDRNAEFRFPKMCAVTARLPQGGRCSVRVVPADGSDPMSGRLAATRTDAEGAMRIGGLVPGRWTALVTRPGLRPSVVAALPFEMRSQGEVADLGELKEPSTVVRGVVRAGGAPAAGAVVTWAVAPGASVATTAGSDGAWFLRVPAGAAGTLVATASGRGPASREFTAPAESADFDLPPEATLVLVSDRTRIAPRRVVVRSGGAELPAEFAADRLDAVVTGAASGPFEVVIGEGPAARTIRGEAAADRVTFVDLASAK